jgi:hypothetical protein
VWGSGLAWGRVPDSPLFVVKSPFRRGLAFGKIMYRILSCVGVFGFGRAVGARPFLLLSFAGPPGLFEFFAHLGRLGRLFW